MGKLPCEYVVTGGTLKCSKGSKIVKIKATNDSNKTAQGKKMCTTADKEAFINVPPFGMCTAGGQLKPCLPFLNKWLITNSKGGNNQADFLVQRATCKCMLGGKITIEDSGQQTPFEKFMELLKKIEEAYPEWSKEQVLNSLTTLSGYGNKQFQHVLGVRQGPALLPKGNLTQGDIDNLKGLLGHDVINGIETGVMTDIGGTDFVMSHALLGILTGANRHINGAPGLITAQNVLVDYQENGGPIGFIIGHGADFVTDLDLDNLPASTTTGDLGQSAAFVQNGQHIGTGAFTYIGPGTEATFPELAGDIDGMFIGELIGSNVNNPLQDIWNDPNASLSDILNEYYSEYTDRFKYAEDFLPAVNGKDYIENETIKFANNYEHTINKRGQWGTKTHAKAANAEYEKWVKQERAKEQKGKNKPSVEQQLRGKETDGTCAPKGQKQSKKNRNTHVLRKHSLTK